MPDDLDLQAAYAKYERGEPLSDEELLFLVRELIKVEASLYKLGPTFRVSRFYLLSQITRIEGFCAARELDWRKHAQEEN